MHYYVHTNVNKYDHPLSSIVVVDYDKQSDPARAIEFLKYCYRIFEGLYFIGEIYNHHSALWIHSKNGSFTENQIHIIKDMLQRG